MIYKSEYDQMNLLELLKWCCLNFFCTIAFVHHSMALYEPLANDYIYAPWREHYHETVNPNNSSARQCPFCSILEKPKGIDVPLGFFKYCFVVLNVYPYSKGHLLIIPYQHGGDIRTISAEARREIIEIANQAVDILSNVLKCHAINFGMSMSLTRIENICGHVPDHLHLHVVPRYGNSQGFMETTLHTTVISWDMQQLYNDLRPSFKELENFYKNELNH